MIKLIIDSEVEPLVSIERGSSGDIWTAIIKHQKLSVEDIIEEFRAYASKELNAELYRKYNPDNTWCGDDSICWCNKESGHEVPLWHITRYTSMLVSNEKGEPSHTNVVKIKARAAYNVHLKEIENDAILENFAKEFQKEHKTRIHDPFSR